MKIFRLSSVLLAVSLCTGVLAQNQLKTLRITDITPELSVYPCGDRQEAQVILRCQEPFDLILASNYDANLNLTVTTDGPEKVYAIVFKTKEEGTSFKGRQLSVQASGFQKSYIPLNLNAKEKLEFLVSDPYSKLRSLFYTSTEEGIGLFSIGMYDAAIDKFNIARQCPEYEEVENHLDTYIAQCDSMKAWMLKAAQLDKEEHYFESRALYSKMLSENPECDIIKQLYQMANENFTRQSRYDIEVAQSYFETKRYEEARDLYEHAIAQNNPQSALAGTNLATIKLLRYKSDNHTRTISYVHEKDNSIGFMLAGLKPDKSGGYFSFGMNNGVIDLAGNSISPMTSGTVPAQPQFQCIASAGWTVRLYTRSENEYVPKLWVLATPFSYAGCGYKTRTLEDDQFKDSFHFLHAVAPEIGIALREWRFILSYRYQFRYVIGGEKPLSDNFGTARNIIGIGFCW